MIMKTETTPKFLNDIKYIVSHEHEITM